MIYPELRELNLFSKHTGETNDDFLAMFEVKIGPLGKEWSETFSFNVLSPKWLHRSLKSSKIEIGHGIFVMSNLDMKIIEDTLKNILKTCERLEWEEVVFSICRYAKWEYELK